MTVFTPATIKEIDAHAKRLKIDRKALLAVCEVEANGLVYAAVNGRREPLIRFEGHYFYKRLVGDKLANAVRLGLAKPKAGAVKNPNSQAKRWANLFNPASAINIIAAFESTSWGIGQVMGAHWKTLGFKTPGEMLRLVRSGEVGQIEVMVRYIEKFGLVDELQRLDFRGFARGYNGPAGISMGYHTKMSKAYSAQTGAPVPASKAAGMLRMGSSGAGVREVQALLIRGGYAVKVDGDFGPSTRDAVKAFQKANGITADGVVGPQTQRALNVIQRNEGETPGALTITELPEMKQSAPAVVGGVALETTRMQVEEVASKVGYIDSLSWLSTGLTVVAAALAIGGIIYLGVGWYRSRKTTTGDDTVIDADEVAADLA